MINSLSSLNVVAFLITSCLFVGLTVGDINWNGNNWAMSCDFHGNDLYHVRSSGELCGEKCAQTNGCTHFAWNKYNGGTCWMKSGSVSKNDAFSSWDRNMVCGVLSENTYLTPSETGSKHSGTAKNVKFTYYWIAFEEG